MANEPNVIVSKFLGLNWQDAVKALILTVITSVLSIVYETLIKGGPIDWSVVGTTAVTTAVGYILKNWLSPTQIIIQNPSKSAVEAVQEGTATAKVVTH